MTSHPVDQHDVAPGDEQISESIASGVLGYLVGFVLAVILTAMSFYVASSDLLWGPGIAMGLVVLAIAQMGVHLVFFLHITTSPDSTNNVLALAFGVFIVFLVLAGSLWIMANLNHNLMPDQMMEQMKNM
ncbi:MULTISPECIES: cytochrome o ubiquinol oxidase subunit IV [Kaistia]|jgi:cytochrome o ubiquinol oxidase operon protein cyoD|uniref:Cytochrome bo(3) ubiquinol oxidase subunit 4 n=1 Tax=Kaistia defluvii TaxID=410841 RepID=A0ABV2QZ75_9HYPH